MSTGFKTATVASADVPATQTNFPVYIDLSRLGITTQAEADSVRVYANSSKTTEWARDIVSVSGCHCKIPSLTSTTSIYVYWDGTSADYAVTDTYGRNAVWSDYEWVFHGTLSSGNLIDSTGNVTTSKYTGNTPTEQTGKLGNGFNPNGAYWLVSSYSPFSQVGSGDFSFQTWMNPNTSSARRSVVYMGRDVAFNDCYYFQIFHSTETIVEDRNKPSGSFRDGTAGLANTVSTTNVDGSMRMYHHTRTGTTAKSYLNGINDATVTNSEVVTTLGISGNSVATIAGAYTTGVQPIGSVVLDEMRFRGNLLSADWITTEYNNQSDEAGFWGTWSDVGGATNTTNFFLMM